MGRGVTAFSCYSRFLYIHRESWANGVLGSSSQGLRVIEAKCWAPLQNTTHCHPDPDPIPSYNSPGL